MFIYSATVFAKAEKELSSAKLYNDGLETRVERIAPVVKTWWTLETIF